MKKKNLILKGCLIFGILIMAMPAFAYERVVSLSPAITEIIYALNADAQLVGVTSYCDYPPQAKSKTSVGGFINPNIEVLLNLHPDLVILSPNSGTKALQKRLDHMGIENLVVSFYSIPGLRDAYGTIGHALGRDDQAAALVRELDETMSLLKKITSQVSQKRVMFVRSHDPLYIAGTGTYEENLMHAVGALNCVEESNTRYPRYSIEEIITRNPDIIIDATYYETPSAQQKKALEDYWNRFQMIAAVAHKHVYIIKTDIHSVPGPRTPAMLNILAGIVHPELFPMTDEYVEQI